MINSRNSVLVAALVVAFAAAAAPLNAQFSGPLDIVPQPTRPPAAPVEEPQLPAVQPTLQPVFQPATPEPAPMAPGADPDLEVASVPAPSPASAGLFEAAEGGFGIDMWRGSSVALIEKLLPHLPAGAQSRAVNDLAARLLLTTATPPENTAGGTLLGIRVERLAAMGAIDSMNELLRAAPPSLDSSALALARGDALLLAGDNDGACRQAREMISRDNSPYWERVLIFCQALAGEHDAAALGVALLRESNIEIDPVFETLLLAIAGEPSARLASLPRPTPLQFAMLIQTKLPIPDDTVASAAPAIARAIALNSDAPLETKLEAAERAESMSAISTEVLIDLYENVPFMLKDLANPLSQAKASGGPMARALVYQAVSIQVVPVARAEVLRSYWQLAFESGGWPGFATAARVTLEQLLTLAPTPELAWVAGDAARALFAAGEPEAARAWLELAVAEAGSDEDAARAVAMLWPIAKLIDSDGQLQWDENRLAAWWDALGDVPEAARRQRAAVLYGVLSALGEEIPPPVQLPLLEGPFRQSTTAPTPALWRQLETAANAGRVGETVLLALIALDAASSESPSPLIQSVVVSALNRVGLVNEARALALEIALAGEL